MQLGDSKQVVVLAVVALVVVGASVFSLLPKSGATVQPRTASSTGAISAPTEGLPVTLLTDPFTHPTLVEKASTQEDTVKAPPRPTRKQQTSQPQTTVVGKLPPLSPFGNDQQIQKEGGSNTDENTSDNREPKVSPQVSAKLVAVLKVNSSTAIVSHGEFSQRVKVGSSLGKWTVVQISEMGMLLKSGANTLKVRVGGEVPL